MSERYTRLFLQTENLYTEGAPILIAAGALLKDNQTGQVLGQLKFRNISAKKIKAVRVKVIPFDTLNRPLGNAVDFQYLDLNISRDAEFGQKTAIPLPDATTRAMSVVLTEVAFFDNTAWHAEDNQYIQLPTPCTLVSHFSDRQMVTQYRLQYGEDKNYMPMRISDLWYCACGALNRHTEGICHQCGVSYSALAACDEAELRRECDERLKKESQLAAERRAREEKEAAEREIEAQKQKKRTQTIANIAALIACISLVVTIIFFTVVLPNMRYQNALSQLETGNIIEAYDALIALNGYKDSESRATSIYEKYKAEKLKSPKVGDSIFFGSYEQDNDASNGQEDIEWLVLEINGNNILVVSQNALDCHRYNFELKWVTWETCGMREWLNHVFLKAAFSDTELSMIPTSTIPAHTNPTSNTSPGNATQDKIFLLSIAEVSHYFSSDDAKLCHPTAYAIANGVSTDNNGNCWWWLRTPGDSEVYAAGVRRNGSIDFDGEKVYTGVVAVRPAMWITIGE